MFNSKQLKDELSEKLEKRFEDKELTGIAKWWDELSSESWQKRTVQFFEFKYRRYIRGPWYDFKYGIRNLIRWFYVVWIDRSWDTETGFYNFTKRKIELVRNKMIENDFIADIDNVSRNMKITINLIEKVRDEFYSMEYFDYHESKFDFIPIENTKYSTMEVIEIWEKYDDYLKKYPSSVRAINKKHGILPEKKRLVTLVAQHNEAKAKKLLFRLLEEEMCKWWD